MLRIHRTVHIACPPEAVLSFVVDIGRYASVDDKIAPIKWARRNGDLVEFACDGSWPESVSRWSCSSSGCHRAAASTCHWRRRHATDWRVRPQR